MYIVLFGWNSVSKIFNGKGDHIDIPFRSKALQQLTFWEIHTYASAQLMILGVEPRNFSFLDAPFIFNKTCQLLGLNWYRQKILLRQEHMRCGYKCVPQWLNDRAHCLKCQNVLRVREGLHDVERDFVFREVDDGRRLAGEASTYKTAPSSAMESASGSCAKAPDGVHHWKYGKCYLV